MKFAGLLSVLMLANQVAAQERVLMWPPQGTMELRQTDGIAARDAVREGLMAAGYQVELLEVEAGTCVDGACVRDTLQSHEVELAAFIAVWARADEESASEIEVTLRSDAGVDHGHRAAVNTDVGAAARQALEGALSNMSGARRAEVTVRSTPSGASLTVDGNAQGQTPARIELSTGSHTFSATLEGHLRAEQRVDITEDTDIRLELESLGDPLESLHSRETPNKRRRIRAIGVALGIAGVGGMATTLAVTLPKIECVDSRPNGCARGRELSVGRFAGWMALSGVSIALGVIVFLSAPDAPGEQSPRAQVALRPTGVDFSLSF